MASRARSSSGSILRPRAGVRPLVAPCLLEPRRALAATGIAEVTPGPVPPDRGPDRGRRISPVLAELLAERRELTARPMERAVLLGRTVEDRRSKVLRRPTRECRPASPDGNRLMRVAVADRRQPVLRREPDDPAMPWPPEHRRVERLDRIGPD